MKVSHRITRLTTAALLAGALAAPAAHAVPASPDRQPADRVVVESARRRAERRRGLRLGLRRHRRRSRGQPDLCSSASAGPPTATADEHIGVAR